MSIGLRLVSVFLTRANIVRLKSMVMALMVAAPLFLTDVHAASIPNFDRAVKLNVREQNVTEFIQTLFSQIKVPVIISSDIEGMVNGIFENSAQHVFGQVSGAFNVVVYYDGAVAHAYNSNEVSRVLLPVDKKVSAKVVKIAMKLGLPDNQNSLRVAAEGALLVTGTRRFHEQIEELSVAIQSNVKHVASPTTYRVFQLKYAWADDTSFAVGGQRVVVPGVASILRTLISAGPLDAVPERTSQALPNTLPKLKGQGLQSINLQQDAAENAQALKLDIRSTGSGVTNSSRSAGVDNVRIVADTRLNAIIIRDFADRMPAYEDLIRSLDVASKMVEIEATIIDVNTDKQRELGVNWRYQEDDLEFLLGDGSVADQLLRPDTLSTPQGRGGVMSLVLGNKSQFMTRIRALEEQGAARIVSKPHVITLSDVEAVLGATTEFFVRLEGRDEVDLFNVPVGTTLRVTPHVFEEFGQAKIKLLVNIEDGTQSNVQQVDRIPVVERASINTQAVINEGDSLLIGGLVRDSQRQSEYKVPLLGDIPLLGRLFKSTRTTSTRVERVFLITPRIAQGTGFAKNSRLPTLQGKSSEILATSSKRMDDTDFVAVEQAKQKLQPSPELSTSATTTSVPATPAANRSRVDVASLLKVPPPPVVAPRPVDRPVFKPIPFPDNAAIPNSAARPTWTVEPFDAARIEEALPTVPQTSIRNSGRVLADARSDAEDGWVEVK